jgi:hypothetical protein
MLKSGEPLLVTGAVVMEGDESPVARLRVREVCLLGAAREKKTSCVHFRVPAGSLSKDRLLELKSILGRFRGACSAYLHIRLPECGSETVLKLPEQVGPSEEMEHEVDSLFMGKVTEFS